MAFGSQIAILNVLVNLNLAVLYRIAIRIYASKKFLTVAQADRQTAKFNSLLNFPAIQYYNFFLQVSSSEPQSYSIPVSQTFDNIENSIIGQQLSVQVCDDKL